MSNVKNAAFAEPLPPRPPLRLAVWLSALVYPGVGQAVQRRWLAAVAFGVLFSAALAVFVVSAARIFIAYYRCWLDFEGGPPAAPRVGGMLGSFVAALGVYLASLADAWRATRRALEARARTKGPASGAE